MDIQIPVGDAFIYPVAERVRQFYPYVVSGDVEVDHGQGYQKLIQSVGRLYAVSPNQLRFRNVGAGVASVEFEVTPDEIGDKRLAVDGVVGVRGGGSAMGAPAEVNVGVAAVEILAANTNRTSALIQAGGSGLFIGPDNTIAAGTIEDIPAGASFTVTHTGAIWAVRSGGAAFCRVKEEVA